MWIWIVVVAGLLVALTLKLVLKGKPHVLVKVAGLSAVRKNSNGIDFNC